MPDELNKDRQPGQVLAVDPDLCTACGICYSDDDELFGEQDDGTSAAKPIPAATFDENEDLLDKAQDAVETCPSEAIGWKTPTTE